jgi:cystathionine beta-synthase
VNDLRVYDRISEAVGWTPLVRLHRAVAGSGCEIFAKIEFLNPMGSIKDRIARYLVEQAIAEGSLGPDGVIVEASSGNTAMGLAMMATLQDLRCKAVVRRQTSKEKLDCLRALGVELVLVDGTLPPEHPESYNRKARQLVAETPGAFFPDQHNNRANNEAHYRDTGPEIWQQMEGRIDVLVAGIGTGGTISGVARYLKERDPGVRVVAVDVEGSVFTEYFRTGSHASPSSYLLEGLGDEEIIDCPEFELIDEMLQISDREAFLAARELARTEAILAGGSSGAALWGVRRVAATLDHPARIVTIFPDSGARYLSTIYNDEWMREHGFLESGE